MRIVSPIYRLFAQSPIYHLLYNLELACSSMKHSCISLVVALGIMTGVQARPSPQNDDMNGIPDVVSSEQPKNESPVSRTCVETK